MKGIAIVVAVLAVAALALYFGTDVFDDGMPGPTASPAQSTAPTALCRPTGCSGQICDDEDVITTCEFRPEYACYRAARCQRQANGQCGWTMTPELQTCLRQF